MKATQQQINIIANEVSADSDGARRSAKIDLAHRLFPESLPDIDHAIYTHPINVQWDEYRRVPWQERARFLLPE